MGSGNWFWTFARIAFTPFCPGHCWCAPCVMPHAVEKSSSAERASERDICIKRSYTHKINLLSFVRHLRRILEQPSVFLSLSAVRFVCLNPTRHTLWQVGSSHEKAALEVCKKTYTFTDALAASWQACHGKTRKESKKPPRAKQFGCTAMERKAKRNAKKQHLYQPRIVLAKI